MNVQALEAFIAKRYRWQRYWSYTVSLFLIISGSVACSYFYRHVTWGYFAFFGTVFILLGIAGLIELKKRYKLTIVQNDCSKEQNKIKIGGIYSILTEKNLPANTDSHLNFLYQRNWWSRSFSIHLFAGDRQIGVNVQSTGSVQGGFLDFGVSKRLERDISNMIY